MTADLNKKGEALQREINTLIQRKQSEIDYMDKQHAGAIKKQEYVIYQTLNDKTQVILNLKSSWT